MKIQPVFDWEAFLVRFCKRRKSSGGRVIFSADRVADRFRRTFRSAALPIDSGVFHSVARAVAFVAAELAAVVVTVTVIPPPVSIAVVRRAMLAVAVAFSAA